MLFVCGENHYWYDGGERCPECGRRAVTKITKDASNLTFDALEIEVKGYASEAKYIKRQKVAKRANHGHAS